MRRTQALGFGPFVMALCVFVATAHAHIASERRLTGQSQHLVRRASAEAGAQPGAARSPAAIIADARMELVSGDGQFRPRVATQFGVDMAQFDPLVVRLTTSDGAPLAAAEVTFTSTQPAAMAVQMEPSGASPSVVVTDAQGYARADKMSGHSVYAYYADGPFTVTASYGSASQTFALSVGASMTQALEASIVSGDNQTVIRAGRDVPGGVANFAPLQLRVTWSDGRPAAGVAVNLRGEGPGGIGDSARSERWIVAVHRGCEWHRDSRSHGWLQRQGLLCRGAAERDRERGQRT